MADLPEQVPDRRNDLTDKAAGSMAKAMTGFALIWLIPAFIFGGLLFDEFSVRSNLRERGVTTPLLERDFCSIGVGRPSPTERICSGTARYAIRPEHGGGVREGTFYRYLDQPVAIYDPENPDRALSLADLEAGPSSGYYAGIVIPLGFSLLFAGLAFDDFRRRRRPAKPGPDPGSAGDYRSIGSEKLVEGGLSRDAEGFQVRRAGPVEAAVAPSGEARAAPPEPAAPDPHVLVLKDLLRLVQQQSGPSSALDLQIYDALFGRPGQYGYQCNRPANVTETYDDELNRSLPPLPAPSCPTFTADVESARLLIPWYMSSWDYVGSDASVYEVALGHAPRGVRGKTGPLAVCAAVIAHYVEYPQELRRNL